MTTISRWFPVQSVTVSLSLSVSVCKKEEKHFLLAQKIFNYHFCFNFQEFCFTLCECTCFILIEYLTWFLSDCKLFGNSEKPLWLWAAKTTKSHRWQLTGGIGLWQFHFLFNLIRRFQHVTFCLLSCLILVPLLLLLLLLYFCQFYCYFCAVFFFFLFSLCPLFGIFIPAGRSS